MKFVFPEIDFIFDTECDKINTLIIENPVLFRSLLQDITDQLSGLDGKAVLSENSKLFPKVSRFRPGRASDRSR